MTKPFDGKMKVFLIAVFVIFSVKTCLCGGAMTASADVGRAKAKISAEEMLKLHRKRRDDDKLFSINSPRKNEENKV